MTELVLEEAHTSNNGSRPVIPSPTRVDTGTAGPEDERVELQGYLAEIDVYYQAIKLFHEQDPDEVLVSCSAFHARLSEIRGRLQRRGSARATQLRTREVDPLLDSIEKQFAIHSRLLTKYELDFKMAGGQR